jgi:hypothetical protein
MLIRSDCCIIAQVSTNVILNNFTVYVLAGNEIFLAKGRRFFSSLGL